MKCLPFPRPESPLLNLHANMEFRPGRPVSPFPAAREGTLDLKPGGPGLQVLCGHISSEGPCAGPSASLDLLFLLCEMMNSPASLTELSEVWKCFFHHDMSHRCAQGTAFVLVISPNGPIIPGPPAASASPAQNSVQAMFA